MRKEIPDLPEACCLNCVFLYEELRDHKGHQPSLRQDVRHALREGRLSRPVELQCYQGIWGPETAPEQPDEDLAQWLAKDRGEWCLFYPHAPGLFPAAAKILEKRAANRDEADKDRRLTRWAFRVAFAALIVSIASTFGSCAWDYWKYHHPLLQPHQAQPMQASSDSPQVAPPSGP